LAEAPLMSFAGGSHTNIHTAFTFTREDYFQLVDVTGCIIRDDKRGAILDDIPHIVSSLGIEPVKWIEYIQNFGKSYGACVGSVDAIADYASKSCRHWCEGVSHWMYCYRQVG
jgi:hypothetical protein